MTTIQSNTAAATDAIRAAAADLTTLQLAKLIAQIDPQRVAGAPIATRGRYVERILDLRFGTDRPSVSPREYVRVLRDLLGERLLPR